MLEENDKMNRRCDVDKFFKTMTEVVAYFIRYWHHGKPKHPRFKMV